MLKKSNKEVSQTNANQLVGRSLIALKPFNQELQNMFYVTYEGEEKELILCVSNQVYISLSLLLSLSISLIYIYIYIYM